ncbi:hypothetical protein DPMN_002183 [Dreissena polymorpha]|uniref:Uncharacterized protein n=1 Tax=Dreissena polymorpha TaxID=45954 RepID=A0A9D4RTL2_DREPO|nr:hypothetical protein DPMN_002183 [Dreissena polymorpha]
MTAVVLCGPAGSSTLNPTLIRTQTQPLAISAQLLQPQESTSFDIVLAQQQHQSGMHEPQSRTTLPLP